MGHESPQASNTLGRRLGPMPGAVLALALAGLLAGCAGQGSHAAPAAPSDITQTDPCTLLNLQQQHELGRIDSVQPSQADPPDSACAYVHSGPPAWTVTITVGPDRGAKTGTSTAQSRPQEITVDGFAATRQQLRDGCIVEVQTGRAEGFAVRTRSGSQQAACASATKAANLAAETVRRRH